MSELWNRLVDRFNRNRLSTELDEELAFHKQMLARDQRDAGASDTDAEFAARRRLGNATRIKEESRARWGFSWMEDISQDLRFGVRALRRTPAFTLTAAVTLALGIGANSAIFTTLYRTVLQRLPVSEPRQLAYLITDRGDDGYNYNWSYAWFDAFRVSAKSYAGVIAHTHIDVALGQAAGAERVQGAAVSRRFFEVLGTHLAMGREFSADEERLGGPATLVLSDKRWKLLGAKPDVLGSVVLLSGKPFTVIGVAREDFTGLAPGTEEQLWVPLGSLDRLGTLGDLMTRPTVTWLDVFARLAPGVSKAQAQAEAAVLDARAIEAKLLRAKSRTVLADGSRGISFMVDSLEQPLVFLMGAVTLVLLIACANVANLLLARAGARRREIAIRLAVGASRWRLMRQLLVENVLLALLGGASGLVVAYLGIHLLLSYDVPMVGRLAIDTSLDWVSVAFTFAVSVCTAIAFGLLPALQASKPVLTGSLKGEGTRARSGARGVRGGLVIAQVALSLTLATGATLFLRTLQNLRGVDVGFTATNVLLASFDLEQAGYDATRGAAFYPQVLQRLRAIPGVEQVAAAQVITPNPGGSHWDGIRVEGYTAPPGGGAEFDANKVSSAYFNALGVQLVAGREFNDADAPGAPMVAIVNESFAKQYFKAGSAVGRHFYIGEAPNERPVQIVGVAHNGKYRDLREDVRPNVYFPLQLMYTPRVTLTVRTSGNPALLAAAVRREVAALDPKLPLFDVRTLAEHLAVASATERMIATLSSIFGVLALLLAALGLFGVIMYGVTQQLREIGVRIALGARPGRVERMIVGRGALLIAGGLLAGAGSVWSTGRFTAGLLYGIAPTDITAFVASAAALTVAGLLAAYIPARRAARIDPLIALRSE